MHTYRFICIYGFALFAMFFGSGNLVFPIKIGQLASQHWLWGFLGLFITGIVLPFLGLLVVKLYNGSYLKFFAEGGFFAKRVLPLFTLSLLGSFGVVPRCITVAHAGMSYILPHVSLTFFSAFFCMATFFFCQTNKRLLDALGKWMSPLLLFSLALLISWGVWTAATLAENPTLKPMDALTHGFLTGYQTMDLFAAFFFSSFIFLSIQEALPANTGDGEVIKLAIKPSILGMLLLSLIYLGLVFLGAYFNTVLTNVPPELMLATIANHTMGKMATFFLGVIMILSCLTTAVALNSIYARYLNTLLGQSEERFRYILASTTSVAFFVSLFDFKGIAAFLAPALEVSYPSIIVLTILSLVSRQLMILKVVSFYGILAIMLLKHFGGLHLF